MVYVLTQTFITATRLNHSMFRPYHPKPRNDFSDVCWEVPFGRALERRNRREEGRSSD